MTIDQAKDATELLAQRGRIIAIQKEMQLEQTLAVLLKSRSRTVTVPEEALPYIEEALAKAKKDIETKIAKL